MIEPTYALGLFGAIAAVVTMLVVGTFASAGLIFTGERKARKASASVASRPDAATAPARRQDEPAV